MNAAVTETNLASPAVLNHDLAEHFPVLAQFETTSEMKKSDLYRQLEPEIERVLASVVGENFAASQPPSSAETKTVRALAWNIERGIQINGIIEALQNHRDLRDRDLLLLTEIDFGMARSGNLFVAREIARNLSLNYAFAPCYIALNKGSGVEAFIEGENREAIHGLGVFSRFPILRAHSLPLPNGKDKMLGKEKRLGSLRALVAEIEHPAGRLRAVAVHLDAHSSRAHRALQMRILLDHLETLPALPTIIGGDWNTTTYNSQSATRAILGYARRVAMGVRHVVRNHYPHPDRYFERELFEELERRGFEYQNFNETGAGTLHYEMDNMATNTNLGDWVPQWCFPFIFWAVRQTGGKCSLKLDWFAGKRIKPAAGAAPKVVGNLRDNNVPLSDHDAIVLDFTFNV